MKKLVSSALLASAVLTTGALATNGDNLIGVSPASRGMGGIGVGLPSGATDAIFKNPAWMSAQKGFNVSFGGILFLPDVKTQAKGLFNGAPGVPPGGFTFDETSDADTFTIPEVAIVNQINDSLTVGIGAFGVSGVGVDYRNTAVQPIQYTNFQFMRIIPAISYKITDALSVGGAVDLAWGSLDMGNGASPDYGVGVQLGVAYDMGMLTFGANYQSAINMKYEKVYDTNRDGKLEDMKLSQPQELAFGIGARPMDNLKVGLDVRWINWSDADGYGDFGWDDQWVIAIGGEYKIDKLALRAGYNYGKSPIDDFNNPNPAKTKNIPDFARPLNEYEIAAFNLVGFPAISEHHFTIGAGYQFTEHFTFHVSYVYSPEAEKKLTLGGQEVLKTKMTQHSIGMGLDWHF